jgi:Fe-Mn family superoxide dismutase
MGNFLFMSYSLPQLKYSYDALKPVFTAEMMELHYAKHHATYVNRLNELLQKLDYLGPENIDDFILSISHSGIPREYHELARFHGGGHANHTFFWNILKPYEENGEANSMPEDLGKIISDTFGSLQSFKEKFTNASMNQLGSGWTWLSIPRGNAKKLFISTTLNHDNPRMEGYMTKENLGFPIFTLDLWEHAYYLEYKNRKADYFEAFWKIVDWEAVAENYRTIVAQL